MDRRKAHLAHAHLRLLAPCPPAGYTAGRLPTTGAPWLPGCPSHLLVPPGPPPSFPSGQIQHARLQVWLDPATLLPFSAGGGPILSSFPPQCLGTSSIFLHAAFPPCPAGPGRSPGSPSSRPHSPKQLPRGAREHPSQVRPSWAHQPPGCSSNPPGPALPQGLCTCCLCHLEHLPRIFTAVSSSPFGSPSNVTSSETP